ncbi:zinc-binding dehydrogenase [uncultured Methanosphaera sp.]|uniref:zinc-binding dehydrogenase n=1 Tax=uncultured Methanosphaera sp. TaxID=262501 RepID=UPI002803CFC6|nr:zinc-binding dehydrogenase [uncultured Methanosphaera sp.]
MGRNFNGSYEEYTLIPESNVFKISDKIINKYTIEEISAIPETFFTAYCSLFDSLKLNDDDIIFIRGASSTVGIAAIQLASKTKAKIITTTRNPEKLESLKNYGATDTLIDDENLIDNILSLYPGGVTKILELIGSKTLDNSFKALKTGGILCITGILGGEELLNKYDPIKQIPNNRYLTSFFSNYPTQQKIDEIFTYIYQNNIKPIIATTYILTEISKAHMKTEKNKKLGKIVVLNKIKGSGEL